VLGWWGFVARRALLTLWLGRGIVLLCRPVVMLLLLLLLAVLVHIEPLVEFLGEMVHRSICQLLGEATKVHDCYIVPGSIPALLHAVSAQLSVHLLGRNCPVEAKHWSGSGGSRIQHVEPEHPHGIESSTNLLSAHALLLRWLISAAAFVDRPSALQAREVQPSQSHT
jgi:hypothetical protein